MNEYGWEKSICLKKLSNAYDLNNSFGYWIYLFYLSKYYEFIDTWIVIAKRRRPITLQVYHHMGAVLGMWMLVVSRSNGGYLFVILNSFIHTIMYFYYAISSIGYKISFKNVITIMQILQFVIGITVAFAQIIFFSDCMTSFDIFAVLFNEGYISVLLFLFIKFYKKTYSTKLKQK